MDEDMGEHIDGDEDEDDAGTEMSLGCVIIGET